MAFFATARDVAAGGTPSRLRDPTVDLRREHLRDRAAGGWRARGLGAGPARSVCVTPAGKRRLRPPTGPRGRRSDSGFGIGSSGNSAMRFVSVYRGPQPFPPEGQPFGNDRFERLLTHRQHRAPPHVSTEFLGFGIADGAEPPRDRGRRPPQRFIERFGESGEVGGQVLARRGVESETHLKAPPGRPVEEFGVVRGGTTTV